MKNLFQSLSFLIVSHLLIYSLANAKNSSIEILSTLEEIEFYPIPKDIDKLTRDGVDLSETNKLLEIESLIKKAEEGVVHSQHILGILYLTGTMVAQDTESALFWIQKAAQGDHPVATYNLGMIYLKNSKNKGSLRLAVQWLKTSAELKNPNAAWMLSKIFDNEKKSPFNSKKSFYWLDKAKKLGMQKLSTSISKLYISSARSSGFKWEPDGSKKNETNK